MATKNTVGTWLVLAVLVLFLLMAIGFSVVGWNSDGDDAGHTVSASGYVAMTLGIVATLALGIGLMALMFYSRRMGHDRNSDTSKDG
jgi:hypothetical protein